MSYLASEENLILGGREGRSSSRKQDRPRRSHSADALLTFERKKHLLGSHNTNGGSTSGGSSSNNHHHHSKKDKKKHKSSSSSKKDHKDKHASSSSSKRKGYKRSGSAGKLSKQQQQSQALLSEGSSGQPQHVVGKFFQRDADDDFFSSREEDLEIIDVVDPFSVHEDEEDMIVETPYHPSNNNKKDPLHFQAQYLVRDSSGSLNSTNHTSASQTTASISTLEHDEPLLLGED